MSVILHDYQERAKADIYAGWNSGQRNGIAVMPTGAGKSVLMSSITLDGFHAGMTQSIIAHRNELVTQMSCHIARVGIPHRVIGSDSTIAQTTRAHRALFGHSFVNPSAKTAVIGVDTLLARKDVLENWCKQNDRWKIDEGHHVLIDNKWGKAAAMFPNAIGLGVSATPTRADGQGLGRDYDGIYDFMVLGPEMRELIDRGFLSDYEVVCPRSDMQVHDSEISASGDWSAQTLRKAAKKSHIVGDVVENYCKYAYGRRAIVFATDVETAGEIASKFNEWGIRAAALSAKTPVAVREKYISEFKTGRLSVLVNVDLFDEGFDVPACDVVIMARPTASLGKYRQMVGRALRYVPGKVALIIDHVSNIIRHKLPDRVIPWTLARRDKRAKSKPDPDDLPLTVCNSCAKPYERFMFRCPHCGAEKPLPEPRERSIEMVEGDLILLDRVKLEAMRKATVLQSAADIAEAASYAAGGIAGKAAGNRQIARIAEHGRLNDAIAQWAAVQRQKGFEDREIYRKFFLASGMDVLTALDASRPRAEMETLANTIEGWYRK